MGGLEAVPDDHLADVVLGSLCASGKRHDRVAGAGERRQEAGESTAVLLTPHTARAEFAQVLVDEVVGDTTCDGVGVASGERAQVPGHALSSSRHLRDDIGTDMWSNEPVADEGEGVSPWERDDWIPDRAVPDAGTFGRSPQPGTAGSAPPLGGPGVFREPAAEDFERDHTGDSARPGATARKVVAAAIVAALVIGSAGALLSRSDDPTDPGAPVRPSTTNGGPTPSTTQAPRATVPVDDEQLEAARPAVATETITPNRDGSVTVQMTELGDIEHGEVPTWTEVQVAVPETLTSIAPTDLITLSQTDVLSITELPSGRSHQVDVSSFGPGLQLVAGDQALALFSPRLVAQLRPDEPVVVTSVPEGIIFVESWTGTGNFIVTTPPAGPDTTERELVLRPDGSIAQLDGRLTDEIRFWSRTFSPAGDVLVTRPGGVYALAPEGDARRIGVGDLLATGDAHWATEECDEQLRCTASVTAWDTGEQTVGSLDAIESFGFIDPATRISPDGRSIAYRDDNDGTGRRKILDVASGSSIDAGRLSQLAYSDSWAADSSGIFVRDLEVEFVDRASGAVTVIEGLGRVRDVATGPFTIAD